MTQTLTITLCPDAAAGADAEASIYVPFACRILSAKYVTFDDVAADATNFATLTLKANDGAGGAFAAIATAITTETAADADTPRAITITSGSEELAAGQIVQLAKTYDGTGAAMAGVCVLEVVREHD